LTMIAARSAALGLVSLFVFSGCVGSTRVEGGPDELDASRVVEAGVDRMGGRRAWRAAGDIIADVVVTVYDEAGRPYTNRHRQRINVTGGTIVATAHTPQGRWTASANKGRCRITGWVGEAATKDRISSALAMLSNRIRGPLNLTGSGERPGQARSMRVGGVDVIRVGVAGDTTNSLAYYFDAGDGMLRFVTAAADAVGGDGTVTLYEYAVLPGGLAFPRRICVVKVGRHVLIGDRPILVAEFAAVEVRRF